MKKHLTKGCRQFQLNLLMYGSYYYIERIAQLERTLARNPRKLQINLIGAGEIPADIALLIRSVLVERSPKTELITNARSSLHGGSVLIWLLGDRRLIRDDARLFFRRANLPEHQDAKPSESWCESEYRDSSASEMEPEEGDYARVLELINEFLPVKELTGKLIEVPVLRQFGLVENEKVDQFLFTAFARIREPTEEASTTPRKKRPRRRSEARKRQANR